MQVKLRMRNWQPAPGATRGRALFRRSFAIATVVAATAALAIPALAVTGTAPDLGTAASFAILAGSTVTNTGPTVVSGDLGVSPGTTGPAVTGFGGPPQGTVTNGTIHDKDATAAQAQADLTTAYNNAAGQKPCTDETGMVLGQGIGTAASPLPPGVFCFTSSAQLTGALYLSGAGVYIFQVVSTLITAPGSSVVLENGASACQIFWQVGSSATLDTTTRFEGTIMALTSISINNGVVLEGRALARNGQVSLINDTITRPTCGTTTSVSGTPSPSTSPVSGTPSPSSTPRLPRSGYPGGGPAEIPGLAIALVFLVGGILAAATARIRRHRF